MLEIATPRSPPSCVCVDWFCCSLIQHCISSSRQEGHSPLPGISPSLFFIRCASPLLTSITHFAFHSFAKCLVKIFTCTLIDVLIVFPVQKMYLAFVRNCKFPSAAGLASLTFMLKSLVELLAIDPPTSYQHGFVYIRQLAIHLRTALTSGKKDCQQVRGINKAREYCAL